MCEQTEIDYLDGDVVWVKLGSCWWPGEVVGPDKLPPDVLPSFRKPPIAVVKFFQETTYEYVKNINCIYKYNCSRKNEFINKGLYMYRTKHGHMEKFPEDVIRAETAVGGDIEILTRDEFQEIKKEKSSYAGLFGDAKKTPVSGKRGRGRGRPSLESPSISTPIRKLYKEKADYKVHILVQGSKEAATPVRQSTETVSTPATSRAGSEVAEDKPAKTETPSTPSSSTPTASGAGTYACPNCPFSTTRLNVLILHNKTHSATYTPYTPSPVRKKPPAKSAAKSSAKTTKTPKTPRSRKEKTERVPKKPRQGKKRMAEETDKAENIVKKPKTEEEIKSSLLADWDDDDADDESNDESTGPLMSGSPELPIGSESPAVPTPAELPKEQVARELSSPIDKKSDETTGEKPESSSDSKYEFCEDEDWPVEKDSLRKIPRIIKTSKRKEDNKSISLDEDEVAKEVAELLNKTAVPELPSVPEPLKIEENFPEPSIVKSPDKAPEIVSEPNKSENTAPEPKPTKAIFKTKTFFRSRHSRSQDAIGKYVAEQLNPERLEMSENELNGSEVVSSPEARESSPVEQPKACRMAPKMQLKKMKAEAAQLREQEKNIRNILIDPVEEIKPELKVIEKPGVEKDVVEMLLPPTCIQNVIYPVQEIKPINEPDTLHRMHQKKILKEETKEKEKHLELTENGKPADLKDTFCETTIEEPRASFTPSKSNLTTAGFAELLEEAEKMGEREKMQQDASGHNDHDKPEHRVDNPEHRVDNAEHRVDNTDHRLDNPIGEPWRNQTLKDLLNRTQKQLEIPTMKANSSPDKSLAETETDKIKQDPPSQSLNEWSLDNSSNKPALPVSSPKKVPMQSIQKTYEQLIQPYMNESTASAVDALLSVSREADRVPKIVGSGPPEDLFEDDNKDISNEEVLDPNPNGNEVDEHHKIVHENVEEVIQEPDKVTDMIVDEVVTETTILEPEIPTDEKVEINEKNDIAMDHAPTESDLQIAETLLNLPSTAIQSKTNDNFESLPMTIDSQHFEETVPESQNVEIDTNTYETNENVVDIETTTTTTTLKLPNDNDLNVRYETELEKSENLNAAQSLVQMSESIDHSINILENNSVNDTDVKNKKFNANQNNVADSMATVEEKVERLTSNENKSETPNVIISPKYETTSSKLLKILEEPIAPKPPPQKKTPVKATTPVKQLPMTGKEKILNFDVANSSMRGKSQPPKQKIIIRRSGTGKSFLNNLTEVVASPDKIILSRSNMASQDGSSVQTFTIQGSESGSSSDPKQIIIQPKIRKVAKPPMKLQKIKPHNSLVQINESKIVTEATSTVTDETMFDINSMPVVLSDDILTPESIEKMPIVMSDGNIITNTPNPANIITSTPNIITNTQTIITNTSNPPKLIQKSKQTIKENEKIAISASPSKSDVRTLLVSSSSDVNKVTTTPNILSKSSKIRGGAKPMLVIDKTTGKQKIIMTKGEPMLKEIKQPPALIQPVIKEIKQAPALIQPVIKEIKQAPALIQPVIKEIKQAPALIQAAPPQVTQKTEKFIILPTASSPRPGRAQKIVIDPTTGKAHVLVAKGQEPPMSASENKPVSAKLIPSSSDANSPGNTVMIITNAQGAQSRIVLTPEHEKILFPNKQQPNVAQLKAITQRIGPNATGVTKTIVTSASAAKTPTRILPKQKSAIITSKGQLIVGGRVATTAQNIAPMPEVRPRTEIRTVPKRIVASEPKKLVQAIQKSTPEPLIFLQQKSGTVMQLTAAQFEHLQRTGQIIQKVPPAPAPENKVVLQKSMKSVNPKETIITSQPQKQRVRKTATASPTPAKKVKHEIAIAPAPPAPAPAPAPLLSPAPPVPPLTAIANALMTNPSQQTLTAAVSITPAVTSSTGYGDLENFEELLPSTAIVRQQEPAPAPCVPPSPAPRAPPPEPYAPPEPPAEQCEPPPAQLAEGQQLLAVSGENFGGPPGSFYLCVEENGTFTPIDNRPLMLDNNQLVPMEMPQPERRDILEAALANSDVFQADGPRDDAPDFRDLNANVSVHCRVSETSTTLNQPIMTPVEVPSKGESEPTVPSTLEDGLAVIGVTPHTVPTSLELPITVTDPRIAPKTTDPLSSSNYGTALLPSPGGEMTFVSEEGPISMPLLSEDDAVGKSMPILTDDAAGEAWRRAVSTSNTSLHSHIQLSINDLSRHS